MGRVRIGALVISLLGIAFGSSLVVLGSFFSWKSDEVLGIFSRSGWSYHNLIGGDGRISLALGALMFCGLLIGSLTLSRISYVVTLAISCVSMAFSVFELFCVMTSPGIGNTGNGLYMVTGGSVVVFFCSLGGLLMVSSNRSKGEEIVAEAGG